MITIQGKSVFGGVSIGKLMFYKRNEKSSKESISVMQMQNGNALKPQKVRQLTS